MSVLGTEGIDATFPSSTVSVTETGAAILRNRQAAMTTATPAVSAIMSSCSVSPLNQTLISIAFSACSCLILTTRVEEVMTTTETAMDYAEKTFINTVTDGVTTITYTNRCYAASYAPFPPTGVSNCFFRTLNNSGHPFTDENYISAILILLPPLNSTNTTSSLGPTTIPSASISISANSTYPTGPTVIPNITITSTPSRIIPSFTPTLSLSSSNAATTPDPSKLPTISFDSSSFPIPSFTIPPVSENRTYSIMPTGSYNSSTYLPTASLNPSSCAWSTITMTATVANATVTVTEEIPATMLTSIVVTTSTMMVQLPIVPSTT
ncbi:hypothetical protein ABVK25_000057 [Lepraria finkii]|uniref:Uncharacterized protein n=1 Tax=Lepraria finkii TaxID=1340010 RepID=A0ABR4BLU3_9LECA